MVRVFSSYKSAQPTEGRKSSALRKSILVSTLVLAFTLTSLFTSLRPAQALQITVYQDLAQISSAYMTYLLAHESGHFVVGRMSGAERASMDFFTNEDDTFFLALTDISVIDPKSLFPYKMGGFATSSYLFESTLRQYRNRPSIYNRSLLLFSGTDLLVYSLWAFYIDGSDNPSYDPVAISHDTGLSHEAIIGIAALQTTLNAYRAYTGKDTLLPYIALDKSWVEMGVQITY